MNINVAIGGISKALANFQAPLIIPLKSRDERNKKMSSKDRFKFILNFQYKAHFLSKCTSVESVITVTKKVNHLFTSANAIKPFYIHCILTCIRITLHCLVGCVCPRNVKVFSTCRLTIVDSSGCLSNQTDSFEWRLL